MHVDSQLLGKQLIERRFDDRGPLGHDLNVSKGRGIRHLVGGNDLPNPNGRGYDGWLDSSHCGRAALGQVFWPDHGRQVVQRGDDVAHLRAGTLMDVGRTHQRVDPVRDVSGASGEELPEEASPDFRRAAQARLDGVGEPARVAREEVRVEVDECTMADGHLGDRGIDTAVVGTGNDRIDTGEVAGVVAERRVIDVANQHRPDRERTHEGLERRGKGFNTATVVDQKAAEQVVSPDSQESDRLPGRRDAPGLGGQVSNGSAIDGAMSQTGRPASGEIPTPELREEPVVVANKKLTRGDAAVIVPAAVEDGVAERVQREHGGPLAPYGIGTPDNPPAIECALTARASQARPHSCDDGARSRGVPGDSLARHPTGAARNAPVVTPDA